METPSLLGLNRLILLVALMETGFGAFLSVYLTTYGWTASEIGFALSMAATTAMLGQVPAGMLVDAIPDKRWAAGIAIALATAAALLIGIAPRRGPVLLAEVMLDKKMLQDVAKKKW